MSVTARDRTRKGTRNLTSSVRTQDLQSFSALATAVKSLIQNVETDQDRFGVLAAYFIF